MRLADAGRRTNLEIVVPAPERLGRSAGRLQPQVRLRSPARRLLLHWTAWQAGRGYPQGMVGLGRGPGLDVVDISAHGKTLVLPSVLSNSGFRGKVQDVEGMQLLGDVSGLRLTPSR